MSTKLFQQLARPARMRSVVDDVLVWLPLPLLLAVAAWRWQGTAVATLVGIISRSLFATVIAGMVAFTGLSYLLA